jgi:hypothetical protein
MNSRYDPRRFEPIEVDRRSNRVIHLGIRGVMWSEVEWSPGRRAWCIQDASGDCLLHCESIVGDAVDEATAIDTARQMIMDGRMPTPEEAFAQHEERQRAKALGIELMDVLEQPMRRLEDLGEPMEILVPLDVSKAPR